MTCAESMKPLALYSMRASATCVEVTVLAAVIVFGLTTPEKRMNSSPSLRPICFSPETSRLPLGIDLDDGHGERAGEIVGGGVLALAIEIVAVAGRQRGPLGALEGQADIVGTLTSTVWLRDVLFSDFFEAWTFSWMLMSGCRRRSGHADPRTTAAQPQH
jgi:hypothetical protein